MKSLRLPATLESLEKLRTFVLAEIEPGHFEPAATFVLQFVLEELLTNIIKYAYSSPDKPGDMEVGCSLENEGARFFVRDWGAPFNPLLHDVPHLPVDLMERSVGGLGIFLAKGLVHDMTYERSSDSNILRFSLPSRRHSSSDCMLWGIDSE